MRAREVTAALVCLVLSGVGCSKCGSGHPYVPYSIGEGGVVALDDDAGTIEPSPLDAGSFFANVAGTMAPANVSQWTVDGLKLIAPLDATFGSGIVRDFDGDGARDAFALAQPGGSGGELVVVYYRGSADGRVGPGTIIARPPLDEAPCDMADGNSANARSSSSLTLVGPHAVFAQIASPCLRESARVLRVVSAERGLVRDRLDIEVKDPPAAAPLSFEADATDRDGDGIDDVALRVTIEPGAAPFEPAPRTSATIRWFDRPAGLSRDPDEPDASLRRVSSLLLPKSKSSAALTVPLAARQLRALYAAICQEGGGPRITASKWGRGITCGPSRALEESGVAEARAFANAGYVLRAISARDRAELPPSTHTPQLVADADAAITRAAPVSSQATLRAVGALPQIYRAKNPAWGALAFDATGKLLVRTLAGVVRVDPAQGDESAAVDVATWPNEVLSPDNSLRWVEAYSPCDLVSLHASFAPIGATDVAGDLRDVLLPVEAPLGVPCSSPRGNPASVTPIAWGASGLEAIVAREPVVFTSDLKQASAVAKFTTQIGPHGSPRSPDGETIAIAVATGILVVHADKSRMFRAPELDGGYGELRDCTVSNDSARVACVRGGRAFVGIWASP